MEEEERLRFKNMAIAHELRTPLTFLRGSMQGMLDGVFPIKQKTISDLLIQVEGLTRIVEDLRTLSLAIDQELVMQRQELDVALVVDAVLASANHCWTQQSFRSKPAFCRPGYRPARPGKRWSSALRNGATGGWKRRHPGPRSWSRLS
ncbi:histidine kinase dimerization/phospho-acceptor domain-containing protein [Rhizobium ruizarguesonis]|uniref:histidine kinase dimerization/phospho-acceptor domain-containing protein n=1 Tax=Rhizobium ruizarguesonis TaxID=2081791 RepID=UPI001CF12993|nr:histidine kinase dimerization/phospho-acceptor domain-containing protein [Rhizobium ruizarguesonis]MCB2404482.1 hypothetical protein [Rhizobium ruizarguesonis]